MMRAFAGDSGKLSPAMTSLIPEGMTEVSRCRPRRSRGRQWLTEVISEGICDVIRVTVTHCRPENSYHSFCYIMQVKELAISFHVLPHDLLKIEVVLNIWHVIILIVLTQS